ncbi:tetratricopeptide repeat protein [Legionella quateirensis]|uniref:Tetratricopeptide repeat protein n=1 Tax=Legionella quateirensis TaxID=45072 RepID=A0A378KXE0_9GAMM|nr:tetratricopeptide repeat protein [Legionella quateirensis]KTD50727.1 Tetratricopeptide repeat protein [Legionella quateirensis]STY18028.1 Putative Zn-dependent protease, contains TPR repeats [Legionella quateirensis]
MSLLNNLLKDLSKQKPLKNPIPLLHAVPGNGITQFMWRLIAGGIIFIIVCIALILMNKVSDSLSKLQVPLQDESAIIVADSVLRAAPLEPLKPISYIPALPPVQALESKLPPAPQLTSEENEIPDWVDTQEDLELKAAVTSESTTINKVYAPQTLSEWHDAQMNKALQSIEEGRDDRAIEYLQEILDKIPNAVNASENLASLYLTYGDFDLATAVVDEGLKHTPSDIPLISIKARLILERGKAAEAVKYLSNYHPPIETYPDFYGTLAAALQGEGKIVESGGLFKSLIQIDPTNGQYWLGYAISLEYAHDLNQAKEAYLRASQSPDSETLVRAYAENRLKKIQG